LRAKTQEAINLAIKMACGHTWGKCLVSQKGAPAGSSPHKCKRGVNIPSGKESDHLLRASRCPGHRCTYCHKRG